MMKTCPECGLPVSDKAYVCPHCGIELKPTEKPEKIRKISRRKRLPNGFGQITKIKDQNLRKPYRAMVTVGKNDKGRPICKLLKPVSYFSTYNEAYEALMKYGAHPYDVTHMITVKELFDMWLKQYKDPKKSDQYYRKSIGAFNKCESLHDVPIKSLEPHAIKTTIESCSKAPATVMSAKYVFNMMFDYAVENGLVDRNPSRMFHINKNIEKESKNVKNPHLDFSDEEMNILWKNVEHDYTVTMMIVQCCMGWRPLELLRIEVKDVDIENWMIKGGMKTEAGTDRLVPIHPQIMDIVKRLYDDAITNNSPTLFFTNGSNGSPKSIEYRSYKKHFETVCENLNFSEHHRPHDCRVHFVMACKNYGVNEYAIKYMVGHVIDDITEKVYTKRDTKWLASELSKVEF